MKWRNTLKKNKEGKWKRKEGNKTYRNKEGNGY